MRILFCGDVVARSGREVIQKYIPYLRKKMSLDCVIVNGENAQHGCGIAGVNCRLFYESGVDVITTGNHVWDHKEMFSYIGTDPRVIRPINFIDSVPGKGFFLCHTPKGDILVINAMGQVFMRPVLDNPFPIIANLLKLHQLTRNNLKAIVIDLHAETTSEKIGLAYYLDGRVSMVVGTHTHVPTADARILPCGTGFLSDAGMCGDYASIIGAPLETLPFRFLKKVPQPKRPDPTNGKGTLCGVYLETDDSTGLAVAIHSICLGGGVPNNIPPTIVNSVDDEYK
ncbi:MAG: YmdB family metallophosphoesterase [Holosporales bacterium]|jgi:metallophosphoesterase (TIGR00282 family)|nr:YmdB family metallophosphoesterase [Holosporales bacterium]